MTKLKKLLAVLIAVITAVVYMPITANAATDEMEIYSIYLGDGNNGDSTLVKSGDEYLLMDVGVFESYSYVDEFLQSKGVTHFSLYLSHFHGDHTGGFTDENGTQPLLNLMSKYEIDNIYLPDPSLLKYKGVTVEEEEETYYRKIQEFYESSDIQSGSYDSKVQYLELGSSFSFGSVDVSIIGPVNPDGFTSPFENGGTTGTIDADKLDEYQNNCSLVAKLVCGNTSFLSAGDTKTEGENSLISKYKNTSVLKSDIYKMSHHGFSPANSETFLSYVQPDYSFASNCSGAGLGETGNYWMINTARKNCAAYGFVYMLGQEKKSLNISVSDDTVSLYREGSSTKLNSQGWCKVYGNDGKNRQYDYYYFGADGKTLSGVQKIDGKYYYLSSGGYRYSGTGLTSNNNYKGMVTCEDGNKRYFLDSTDEMVVGFKEIDDGTYDGLYYFASNGVLQTSTNNGWEKMKIGSYYYSVYKSGFISQNVFKQYGSGYCYFGSDGKMA
ncbi:MAG: hypothetical protein LIO62_03810, partial [Clostridiales bacterium]|nr:hypothetical protein [Clostridiales bacterium]